MKNDSPFGPEWTLLELLTLGLGEPERRARFEQIVTSGELHWGELLEQAIRHKVEVLLAYHLSFGEIAEALPVRILRHLRGVYDVNLHRRKGWYETLHGVITAFEAQGISVAGRKQVSFEGTLYEGNGSRRLGDIDLLILPRDMKAATAALEELGFAAIQYDWCTDELVPVPRREMMIYRLSPDHLPIMIKKTGDQVTRFIDIDCASSLTWAKSPYEVPLDEVLATVEHVSVPGAPGVKVPVVAPEYEVIGTVLHLFREAWFERWLDWEQDVDLAKFGDVIRLMEAHRDKAPTLREAIERHGVREPVLWVLEHMDRAFGTDSVATLGWSGEVDEDWLSSAHDSGGKPRKWRGTMRQRLYARDRKALFAITGEGATGEGATGENHD
jgi:hypothetical protein